MTTDTHIPALGSLEPLAYLDDQGQVPAKFEGKVGVYAIFDADRVLQYIGYSRDVAFSLKQHLVRQPQRCYWVKVQTIDRPSRTLLEEIRAAWIAENGALPAGNGAEELLWSQAIDAKQQMTDAEKAQYAAGDQLMQTKLLKQVARRAEEGVLAALRDRGVQMQIRFNPKLKESGLLDLKSP